MHAGGWHALPLPYRLRLSHLLQPPAARDAEIAPAALRSVERRRSVRLERITLRPKGSRTARIPLAAPLSCDQPKLLASACSCSIAHGCLQTRLCISVHAQCPTNLPLQLSRILTRQAVIYVRQGSHCSMKCLHGMAHFDTCQCIPGWVGKACERPLCHQTCAHGACVEPNK